MTLILSVTTNCLTTFVIALKLWCVFHVDFLPPPSRQMNKQKTRAHRALVMKTFSCSRRKVQDILVILVESGFAYGALQVGYYAWNPLSPRRRLNDQQLQQITYMAVNFNQYDIDNFVATVAFEDINLALSVSLPVYRDCVCCHRWTFFFSSKGPTSYCNDPRRSAPTFDGGPFSWTEHGEWHESPRSRLCQGARITWTAKDPFYLGTMNSTLNSMMADLC